MATPQRNIPPTPPPNPSPLKDDSKVAKDVGASVTFGWGWIVLAIVIILVIWFGGFGWGTYGGWWWGHHPSNTTVQPANVSNGQTPTANAGQPANNGVPAAEGDNMALGGEGVQILTSHADKAGFAGRPFVIRNVLVVEKNSPRAYWIGAPNVTPMLVVLTPAASNSSNTGINQNTRVDVTGVVARTVSADQAKRMWSLSDVDANRLEHEGAYVQATQMEPTPQNGKS